MSRISRPPRSRAGAWVFCVFALAGCEGELPNGPGVYSRPEPTIAIEPKSIELSVGQTFQLHLLRSEGWIDACVSWSSSRPEVATVTRSGLVLALAEGTATVLVGMGDIGATAEVTVMPRLIGEAALVMQPRMEASQSGVPCRATRN